MQRKTIVLTEKQKEFLWQELDMACIYENDNNKYSKFETAKLGEWRIDYNGDKDYPYSLFVCIDYWDDLTQDFVEQVLQQRETMRVCRHCLMAIESREGKQVTRPIYVDSENEEESKCEWCEDNGFDTLYEFI